MSINVFTFSGRLCNTPKEREVGDSTVCNFSVAVNNYAGKDKEQDTFFVECTIWGNRGKFLTKLEKGTEISVSGKLTLRKWNNKDGVEKTTLGCFVNDYEVYNKPSENSKSKPRPKPEPEPEQEQEDDDEDVPF